MYHFIAILLLSILTACQQSEQEPFSIEGAWIREAPPNASAMAGYVTIKNNTEQTRVLSSANSAQFNVVEIHRTIVENGIAKMRRQKDLPIPAGDSLKLEPGSYHLMLMTPKAAFKAGDEITVTVHLDTTDQENLDSQEINIVMPVKKP